jgi:AraC-like DNA-binding protein
MKPTSAFATSNVLKVASTDVDEFGDAISDWDVELRPLRPGTFDGLISVFPLGPALICTGQYVQPLLQHVVGRPDDCLNINRPGRGSTPLTFQGRVVEEGEVFVSGSGSDCETTSRGVLFPTALSIKMSFLESQTHWLHELPSLSARSVSLRAPGVKWTDDFLDAMEWLVAAVAQYPDIAHSEDVCGSMLDVLLSRIDTLGVAKSPPSEHREALSARRLAVGRAREYIHQNLSDPIRLSDLCKYARTQARSLEYGFHEVVGLSPIAYIRTMRLHRVRQLLRSTAVRTRSISEIALDCGFWHLSQFAVDYKRLFAESPSITYRRTHSQLPRMDRRGTSALQSSAVVPKAVQKRVSMAASC